MSQNSFVVLPFVFSTMSDVSARDGDSAPPRVPVKMLPLTSKRLTAVHLRRLAQVLEIPASAMIEDTRLMIDGKLTEIGKEPQNVQVIIADPEEG